MIQGCEFSAPVSCPSSYDDHDLFSVEYMHNPILLQAVFNCVNKRLMLPDETGCDQFPEIMQANLLSLKKSCDAI
jgi:hypothetical protein